MIMHWGEQISHTRLRSHNGACPDIRQHDVISMRTLLPSWRKKGVSDRPYRYHDDDNDQDDDDNDQDVKIIISCVFCKREVMLGWYES